MAKEIDYVSIGSVFTTKFTQFYDSGDEEKMFGKADMGLWKFSFVLKVTFARTSIYRIRIHRSSKGVSVSQYDRCYVDRSLLNIPVLINKR